MTDAASLLLATLQLRGAQAGGELRQAWRSVRAAGLAHLVAFEGCTVWLHRRLTELGAIDDLDPSFAAWLARRARHATARNLGVDAQRDALIAILNDLAVPHVLLKGAARRLLSDCYPYADARATGDVDVLVPRAFARPTWQRLLRMGFEPATHGSGTYDRHFHLPPLQNGRAVPVEIHTSTSVALDPDAAWRRLDATARASRTAEGIATRVPSGTELFWHAVTHAPLDGPHAFRLRVLQDAAVIWAGGDDIDWDEIGARLGSGEFSYTNPGRAWLGAAASLAGSPPVHPALGDLERFDLRQALRWRLRVFRLVAPPPAPAVAWTDPAPALRLSRLLIAEGTRAALRLGPTPAPRGTGRLASLGRILLSRMARLCYHVWFTLGGLRRPAFHHPVAPHPA